MQDGSCDPVEQVVAGGLACMQLCCVLCNIWGPCAYVSPPIRLFTLSVVGAHSVNNQQDRLLSLAKHSRLGIFFQVAGA